MIDPIKYAEFVNARQNKAKSTKHSFIVFKNLKVKDFLPSDCLLLL